LSPVAPAGLHKCSKPMAAIPVADSDSDWLATAIQN
jgi:hypothetical protein